MPQETCEVPEDIRACVTESLGLVRKLASGDYAIALGGSYAKGVADAASDIDLYLFAATVHCCKERKQLTEAFSSEIADVVCWGSDTSFTQDGTDFRFRGRLIETLLRSTIMIDQIIEECRQGIVKRELVTWTTTGFYNHCCLSDINVMIPLEDPAGVIHAWKSQIAVYPPKLRHAIIRQHLDAARYWPGNPHCLSAFVRGDVIYVTGIVQQVVHNVLQVLFALNETYFPGDKKLRTALDHLAIQPPHLSERVDALLWPGSPATQQTFIQQQTELRCLVSETEALVRDAELDIHA